MSYNCYCVRVSNMTMVFFTNSVIDPSTLLQNKLTQWLKRYHNNFYTNYFSCFLHNQRIKGEGGVGWGGGGVGSFVV